MFHSALEGRQLRLISHSGIILMLFQEVGSKWIQYLFLSSFLPSVSNQSYPQSKLCSPFQYKVSRHLRYDQKYLITSQYLLWLRIPLTGSRGQPSYLIACLSNLDKIRQNLPSPHLQILIFQPWQYPLQCPASSHLTDGTTLQRTRCHSQRMSCSL